MSGVVEPGLHRTWRIVQSFPIARVRFYGGHGFREV